MPGSSVRNELCMFRFDSSEFSYYMPENIASDSVSAASCTTMAGQKCAVQVA